MIKMNAGIYIFVLLSAVLLFSMVMMGEANEGSGDILGDATVPANKGTAFGAKFAANDQQNIPTYITEDHHSVLKFWFNASLLNHVPKGATLIHFDSHPDLSVPKVFRKGIPKKLSSLEDNSKIDIASFILAGVWAGVVDHVVWVRPDWAHQMDDTWRSPGFLGTGPIRQRSGLSNVFKITYPELYWGMNNLTVQSTKYLEDPQHMLLTVVSLTDLMKDVKDIDKSQFIFNDYLNKDGLDGPLYTHLGVDKDTPYILDIDLDFFATLNPEWDRVVIADVDPYGHEFLESWKRECVCPAPNADGIARQMTGYERTLKRISVEELYMQSLEEFLNKTVPLQELFCSEKCGVSGKDVLANMYNWITKGLIPTLKKEHEGKNLKKAIRNVLNGIHTASNVPHCQKVSMEELKKTIENTETLLHGLGARPGVTTVCRSVADGFTPLSAWIEIEGRVLECLKDVFTNTTHILDSHNGRTVGYAPSYDIIPKSNIIVNDLKDLPKNIVKTLKKNKQVRFYYDRKDEFISKLSDGLSLAQRALQDEPSSNDDSGDSEASESGSSDGDGEMSEGFSSD